VWVPFLSESIKVTLAIKHLLNLREGDWGREGRKGEGDPRGKTHKNNS
jgi:hypothetical protein